MRWSILLIFIALTSVSSASDNDEWVLHFVSWSNWGAKAELWLNSRAELVVGDGGYWQNIPCSENLKPEHFNDLASTMQQLIVLSPVMSDNRESGGCIDEPRVRIDIALQPEIDDRGEVIQPLLLESFSSMKGCNNDEVHDLWWTLSRQLAELGEAKLEQCQNSPFKNVEE